MAADFEVADISLALISRGVGVGGGCSTLWGDLRGFLGWAASLSALLPGWMLEPISTVGIVLGSVSEDSSGNKCKKK